MRREEGGKEGGREGGRNLDIEVKNSAFCASVAFTALEQDTLSMETSSM